MAIILMHPATHAGSSQASEATSEPRFALRAILLAVAGPALALALSWGMVDALAFTQNSLMSVYSAASSATV